MSETNRRRPSVVIVRREPASLTGADRDEIERFITRHSNWRRDRLDQAIDASAYVWLCYDGDRLVGTTAVKRLAARVRGRAVTVIYTAAVAVAHEYRRLGLVPRMGMKSYLVERLRAPLAPIYWLALAGSPAGYLQMARNFVEYWPRSGAAIPADARAVLEQALAALGITHVDEVDGAYVSPDDFGVREREQDPDRWDRSQPDIDFFLRVNPEYRSGNDLACVCPLGIVPMAAALARGTVLRSLRAALPRLDAATKASREATAG